MAETLPLVNHTGRSIGAVARRSGMPVASVGEGRCGVRVAIAPQRWPCVGRRRALDVIACARARQQEGRRTRINTVTLDKPIAARADGQRRTPGDALVAGTSHTMLITWSVIVGTALVLVMLLGAMCAYVLARFEFFGRSVIYYSMLGGLTFPVFLVIVPLGRKPGCSNLVLPRLLAWLCHKGATTVQRRCATDRQ